MTLQIGVGQLHVKTVVTRRLTAETIVDLGINETLQTGAVSNRTYRSLVG